MRAEADKLSLCAIEQLRSTAAPRHAVRPQEPTAQTRSNCSLCLWRLDPRVLTGYHYNRWGPHNLSTPDRDAQDVALRAIEGPLEIAFETEMIRKATLVDEVGEKILGKPAMKAYRALVSDFRDALRFDETLDEPIIMAREGAVTLKYHLADGIYVEVAAISKTQLNESNWKSAHRLKLIRIRNAEGEFV